MVSILRGLLKNEERSLYRTALLFLLGQTSDRSVETLSILGAAINDADKIQRQAASVSLSRLKPKTLSPGAREAIIDAVLTDYLYESFTNLPWDAPREINDDELLACLDKSDLDFVAESLISSIESGKPIHDKEDKVIELLFPPVGPGPSKMLTTQDLSPLQIWAIRALVGAIEKGHYLLQTYGLARPAQFQTRMA